MKTVSALIAAAILLTAGVVAAADLDGLRRILTPLRQSTTDPAPRAPREFLIARDALGNWIESRLADLPQNGDADAFAKTLNAEIAAKDLVCVAVDAPGYNRCTSPGEVDARGFLGAIEVARVRDLLIVQAETGIPCGFDETAYVYEWVKNGWRRLVDTTQASEGGLYVAEQIQWVSFVNAGKMPRDALLLAVTGVTPVCKEEYRPVHYRVWSVKRGSGSSLVVDGREADAFTAMREPAVSARFEGSDLLVEMDVRSIDSSRRSRVAVRRFNFDTERAVRIAPFALSPRDFVEEWLRAPWSEASNWTRAGSRNVLAQVHNDIHARDLRARFGGASQRCAADAAVQVSVRFADGERFFRVKNDSAGAYQMLEIGSAPGETCTQADAGLDTPRSLF